MKYRYCDFQDFIPRDRYNDHYLQPPFELEKDEVLIFTKDTYVYYESDFLHNVRKCFIADGISTAEVRIITDFLVLYREMSNVSEVLSSYKDVSYEKYINDITILITRIMNRGKLCEDEKICLIEIFTEKKSKKDLIKSGKYTERYIHNAFRKMTDELKWCYDINRKWLLDIIGSFESGNLDFSYTPQAFESEYKIDINIINDILKKISHCKKVFTEEEKNIFVDYTDRFMNSGDFTQNELIKLMDLSEHLKTFMLEEYDSSYTKIAESIIDKGLKSYIDIALYCVENGYDIDVIKYMRRFGVKVEFKRYRRANTDMLIDYSDENQ